MRPLLLPLLLLLAVCLRAACGDGYGDVLKSAKRQLIRDLDKDFYYEPEQQRQRPAKYRGPGYKSEDSHRSKGQDDGSGYGSRRYKQSRDSYSGKSHEESYKPDYRQSKGYKSKPSKDSYKPSRRSRENSYEPDYKRRKSNKDSYEPDYKRRKSNKDSYEPDYKRRKSNKDSYEPDYKRRKSNKDSYEPDYKRRKSNKDFYKPDYKRHKSNKDSYEPDYKRRKSSKGSYEPDYKQRKYSESRPSKGSYKGLPKSRKSYNGKSNPKKSWKPDYQPKKREYKQKQDYYYAPSTSKGRRSRPGRYSDDKLGAYLQKYIKKAAPPKDEYDDYDYGYDKDYYGDDYDVEIIEEYGDYDYDNDNDYDYDYGYGYDYGYDDFFDKYSLDSYYAPELTDSDYEEVTEEEIDEYGNSHLVSHYVINSKGQRKLLFQAPMDEFGEYLY